MLTMTREQEVKLDDLVNERGDARVKLVRVQVGTLVLAWFEDDTSCVISEDGRI